MTNAPNAALFEKLRGHSFTYGELMDAVAVLAALRRNDWLIRVIAAHDSAGHYELDPQRDCGMVPNMTMQQPTVGGHDPVTGRLTPACALANLLEDLWHAEEDLLQLKREQIESDDEPTPRRP